jgi:hypothetical protein
VTLAAQSVRYAGVCAIAAVAALAAGAALAASSIVKRHSESTTIAAGQTRTLTVPYPDALKYGNARYSGSVMVLAPKAGVKGRPPKLAKVRILEAQSVLGGSEYQARAHNGNAAGTAAVRFTVTATTLEPLPHS